MKLTEAVGKRMEKLLKEFFDDEIFNNIED